METLVVALGPAFIVALAIQQVVELVRSLMEWRGAQPDSDVGKAKVRFFVGFVAFVTGVVLAAAFEPVRILQAFRPETGPSVLLDVIVTGFVVSGGTEGLNSFLKFLGYTKEKKENEAKTLKAQAQLMEVQKARISQR